MIYYRDCILHVHTPNLVAGDDKSDNKSKVYRGLDFIRSLDKLFNGDGNTYRLKLFIRFIGVAGGVNKNDFRVYELIPIDMSEDETQVLRDLMVEYMVKEGI